MTELSRNLAESCRVLLILPFLLAGYDSKVFSVLFEVRIEMENLWILNYWLGNLFFVMILYPVGKK